MITQEYVRSVSGRNFTAQQWQQGLRATLKQLYLPMNRVVVLEIFRYFRRADPNVLPEAAQMFNLAPGPLKRLKRNTTTPSGWLPERAGSLRRCHALVLLDDLHGGCRKIRGVLLPVSRHR